MNAHAKIKAPPPELADLEDLVCRVQVMATIAWDALTASDGIGSLEDEVKVFHLVRATRELALELERDFYDVLAVGQEAAS